MKASVRRLLVSGLFLAATLVSPVRASAWPSAPSTHATTPVPVPETSATSSDRLEAAPASEACPPCPCAAPVAAPAPDPISAYAYPQYAGQYTQGYAPEENTDGEQDHDGFYLRAYLGPARTSFTSNESPTPARIGGGGASFGFSIGGALREGLILYGQFAIAGPGAPLELEGPVEVPVNRADLIGFGVGAAYYTVPSNFYVSVTALASYLSTRAPGVSFDSRVGPGASLMLGKEWWVSADWGLGVAAQMWMARLAGGELSALPWNATVWALAFSATYN